MNLGPVSIQSVPTQQNYDKDASITVSDSSGKQRRIIFVEVARTEVERRDY